jgi:dienelactone hydrolase
VTGGGTGGAGGAGAGAAREYRQLGPFSDLVDHALRQRALWPPAPPGPDTRRRVRRVLGFADGEESPGGVRVESRWQDGGLAGEEVSWSVGYGPRTRAWVLQPAGAAGPLPGVVALHGHDGFKLYGKEKIADGPGDPPRVVRGVRTTLYEGRAFANALARSGFVVLVPDVFLWGSRGFPLETMPEAARAVGAATRHLAAGDDVAAEVPAAAALYNAAAGQHEHLVEKYCTLLGTTLAGVVSHEDRVAVEYMRSRPDVADGGVGCVGLSGGGCRAALLQATCEHIAAAVVVGMMSTYEQLLDHSVADHTWMFFPSVWARYGDWPDLAACRAPSPLLVQYNRGDHLFTPAGMRAAHERLVARYREAGRPEAYTGQLYDGPHKFDVAMQEAAFAWLHERLDAAPPSPPATPSD